MTAHPNTLHLPEPLYERFRRRAESARRGAAVSAERP